MISDGLIALMVGEGVDRYVSLHIRDVGLEKNHWGWFPARTFFETFFRTSSGRHHESGCSIFMKASRSNTTSSTLDSDPDFLKVESNLEFVQESMK